jgi:4-hydroxybenzoate polyprenyltransferase
VPSKLQAVWELHAAILVPKSVYLHSHVCCLTRAIENILESFETRFYNLQMVIRRAASKLTSTVSAWLPGLIASTRPMSSLVAGTLSSAVFWTRTGLSVRGILVGLSMFSLTAFGFVVNDILDYHKDVAAGVMRPIATGILSRKAAMLFALALLLSTYAVSALVGSGGKVLAATALALLLYTPAAQYLPLIKGFYVAALCLAPLYYGSDVSRAQYPWPSYGLLAVFVVGREALMDANEVRGDRSADMVTIAVVFGEARTKWLGTCIMALSLTAGVMVASGGVAKAALLAALLSLLCVINWPHLNDSRRVELSRIPMLAAAVGIACG